MSAEAIEEWSLLVMRLVVALLRMPLSLVSLLSVRLILAPSVTSGEGDEAREDEAVDGGDGDGGRSPGCGVVGTSNVRDLEVFMDGEPGRD